MMDNLTDIIGKLTSIHTEAQKFAANQVNQSLTFRNWLFGYYLEEYKLYGQRAEYGKHQLKNIAEALNKQGIKGMTHSSLYRCKQFYQMYPQIFATLSRKLKRANIAFEQISATLSQKLKNEEEYTLKPELLVSRLNYSHFIELLKVENPTARKYYEVSAIKENWSVRELRRAIHTMMYERSGLSNASKLPETKSSKSLADTTASILRNPLILEFLDIPQRATYSENDLEQAIINDLQSFLMELGRGFCFEARQKRITFDNTHYYIDLVFYHRILKCHVLIDLKLGEFNHADAGQMNLYLNYFKENEKEETDNPPIGIVLCAQKNDALVHYATGGMSQELFVGKYMLALPSEKELRELIRQETEKLNLP